MKVVLFCGGLGLRIRDEKENVPKPMVEIGYRPILWHIMRYYAHYGHNDFILCLGYRGDVIKRYFLNYDECISNDFVLTGNTRDVELLRTDIHDWRITFVDTGLKANIGERLVAVRNHLEGEDMFLANYADGVTDLSLPEHLDQFEHSRKVGTFVAVKPSWSFHVVDFGGDGLVQSVRHIADTGVRINGGFFAFRPQIFDYMREGEELVLEPFQRLIAEQQLLAYNHDGFWASMDTFKERQLLDDMYSHGDAPWAVWRADAPADA
jgi:glucose-1-phosphate cytidylyltransferase